MRFLIVFSLAVLSFSNHPALALSCAPPQDPDALPQNELIVRARVADIKTRFYFPFLQEPWEQDDIVTFEVLDIYKGPENFPATFRARLSPFFKSWGPDLQPGQEGEYLFDRAENGWDYAGPGGCNFVSDKAWQELRQKVTRY